MKAIIKIHLRKFFTKKLLFLVIGCVLFSIGERQSTSASYELYVLNMLTEHYYLTYFMIPLYLLYFYQSLETQSEFVLIRMAYFWKSFLARVVAIFINAFSFVTIQVIIFLVIGLGLSKSNLFPTSFSMEHELAYFLGNYFSTPVIAIITVTLFMIVGLFTVSVATLAIHHFFEEKITLIILIGLYIFMTFGIKTPGISQIPFLFINSYIIFHHNFAYEGKLLVTMTSTLIIYLAVYILIKHFWQHKPTFHWNLRIKGVIGFYMRQLFTGKNILVCLGITTVISLWKVSHALAFEGATFRDYLLVLFYGHGSAEFHLLSFIEMLIMNSIPLYLIAIFLEEEDRDRNLAITIRLKHKKSWLYAIVGNCISFIAFYVVSLITIGSLIGIVFGLKGQALLLVLGIALLKFLDLSFQFLLMFLLYSFKRNITLAFLIVMATNVISIWFIYFPTGISSMARSEEMGGISFVISISILLISLFVTWACTRGIGLKKMFLR